MSFDPKTLKVTTILSVHDLAAAFCSLDDEQQAKFFTCVGDIMDAWGAGKMETQCFNIGRYLAHSKYASQEARDVVNAMANGIEFHQCDDSTEQENNPDQLYRIKDGWLEPVADRHPICAHDGCELLIPRKAE